MDCDISLDMSSRAQFDRNGFLILRGVIPLQLLRGFKAEYERLISTMLYRQDITHIRKQLLDAGMIGLSDERVAELYDTSHMMPSFIGILSAVPTHVIRHLFDVGIHSPLYGFTQRCRIDKPHDSRRTYGWHQEVFYTIPRMAGHFIQTWAPLMRDTTKENGTIEVCVGSHKEGVAKQEWTDKSGGATQIIVDPAVVAKYEQRIVEMQLGDLLLFDSRLFHRSGQNTSKQVRYSLVGMYHDVTHPEFCAPKLDFKYRGETPYEYYCEHAAENL